MMVVWEITTNQGEVAFELDEDFYIISDYDS